MSDYVESKFKLDYRKFDKLPTQHIENLDLINQRIRQAEHIQKLQKEISDMELSLAAETKLLSDDILRQNVFPRFNSYSDFVSNEYLNKETVEKNPTFGNLAVAIENKSFDEKFYEKIYTMFEFLLENFIWVFFEGCGAWMVDEMKDIVVDYDHYNYVHGSYNDSYPPTSSYYFNVSNSKNGKTYIVSFSFYDLSKAIDYQYMCRGFSEYSIRPTKPYESLRIAGLGRILCTIVEMGKSKSDGNPTEVGDKLFLKSFDPLEIAAFVRHVVLEEKDDCK